MIGGLSKLATSFFLLKFSICFIFNNSKHWIILKSNSSRFFILNRMWKISILIRIILFKLPISWNKHRSNFYREHSVHSSKQQRVQAETRLMETFLGETVIHRMANVRDVREERGWWRRKVPFIRAYMASMVQWPIAVSALLFTHGAYLDNKANR